VDALTALTHALPHRLLSSLARGLAYSKHPRVRRWLIDTVTQRFGVDLSEALESDAHAYESFNAFFTRALRPGARTPDPDPRALLMPADGRISQCGAIEQGRIFQAKGQSYTAAELLADAEAAAPYADGLFATVYLSPRDYHRVHMPWRGRLLRTVHVPGRLFSVGPAAVQAVPRLFARNERLVCHFECDFGPMVGVMVGAVLVSERAFFHPVLAARCEMTAVGQISRAGHDAFDGLQTIVAVDVVQAEFWDRFQQALCVRVLRPLEDLVNAGLLDDFPCVHYAYPVGGFGNHAEIVRDQQDCQLSRFAKVV